MLKIKNWNKIIGETFCHDRYLCSNFEENNEFLQFWFKDLHSINGGVWIKIKREPKWSVQDNEYQYMIERPDKTPHWITTNWFGDMDNVRWAFEDALK